MNWIRLINSTSIFRILLKRLRYLLQLANIISFFLTLLPPLSYQPFLFTESYPIQQKINLIT